MYHQKPREFLIAAILLLSFLCGCGRSTPAPISEAPAAPSTTEALTLTPVKILFIGNSLTLWNEGLDVHLKRLVDSSSLALNIETDSVVKTSAPLESLWKDTNAREAIHEGDYDVVVLQEDMPLTDAETFHEYARKFDAEIKEAGAETVLLMAWQHKDAYETGVSEQSAQAHRDTATELGASVAPVSIAWKRVMEERPDVALYSTDDVHPSLYGTYLAANVVYATIYDESPVGLASIPTDTNSSASTGEVIQGISEEAAAFLQRIAWETVQAYQTQQ